MVRPRNTPTPSDGQLDSIADVLIREAERPEMQQALDALQRLKAAS